jgi:ubiquinone/menaquinone biosynthesis C-methylase UbiE
MGPTITKEDWNNRYGEQNTPWDTGRPSTELARVLDTGVIPAGRTLELGCGSGTNAVYLAKRGFTVTAVDLSSLALEQASQRAKQAGVEVTWVEGDVTKLPDLGPPFDFVFDRGCYHGVRRSNLAGFLETLRRVTGSGSKYLVLAGNANEPHEVGPPQVHEHELRQELGGLFTFDDLREFRFDENGDVPGFLAWSCLLTRKP